MESVRRNLFTRAKWLLLCVVTIVVFGVSSCSSNDIYQDADDLTDKRLAVLEDALCDSLVKALFPEAELEFYNHAPALFLDIEAGRRDAAILDVLTAKKVLDVNPDYACLDTLDKGNSDVPSVVVLVPKAMYAPSLSEGKDIGDWYNSWKNRIHRNVLADEPWHLITGGLYTTVVIFSGAALLAFALAFALTYMGINHKWPWIYKPLHAFVFTIHDIPSVVLMMFFYYVVFASSSISGIAVAAIALGVYSSASLTKIFKIHVTQISKEQREAGLMLGLTSRQVYRYIIFPQAVSTMLPLVIAEMKLLLRSTSYAGYIAQKDLVKAVDAIRGMTFDAFFPLLVVSLLYLLLSWLITKAFQGIGQRMFVHD